MASPLKVRAAPALARMSVSPQERLGQRDTLAAPVDSEPKRLLEFLVRQRAIRVKRHILDEEAVRELCRERDFPVTPRLLAFEAQFGGYQGSWYRLGLSAMQQRDHSAPNGWLVVGERGPAPISMDADGCVACPEPGLSIMTTGSFEVWLELETLRCPLQKRPEAFVVQWHGIDPAALAAAHDAQLVPQASDSLVTTWILPKSRSVLVAHTDVVTGTFPTLHAGYRLLETTQASTSVSISSIKQAAERAMATDAPDVTRVKARASFGRATEHDGCRVIERTLAVRKQGEIREVDQWTRVANGPIRSHLTLKGPGSSLQIYLGVDAKERACWAPLSGAELCFDPAVCPESRASFDASLYDAGFPSSDAAWAFEEQFGGLSLWTTGAKRGDDDSPVVLGVAQALASGLWWHRESGGSVIPIGSALDRGWVLKGSGEVRSVDEDPIAFRDVASFIAALRDKAGAWKRFVYPVIY